MYSRGVKHRAQERFSRPLLAAAAMAALVLAGCAAPTPAPAQAPAATVQVAPVQGRSRAASQVDAKNLPTSTPTLQIVAVDDRGQPFAEVDDKGLPRDIELETEHVPAGLDAQGKVYRQEQRYAVARTRQGESAEQTRARLLKWLAHVDLAAGERFAVQDVYTLPPDGASGPSSARSYVLEGAPIITSADIASVKATTAGPAMPMCEVAVSLSADGGRRFLDATRRLVKRRIAILVDGAVKNAPVVMGPISGGHLMITVDDDVPDSCPRTHRIAALLRKDAHGRGNE